MFEWAAKLVKEATFAANNTVTQIQNALDSALSNLDKANKRANDAYELLHSQAKIINELQQKDLDREKFLAEIGVVQYRMKLEGERNQQLISSVKAVGERLVQSMVMPNIAPPALPQNGQAPSAATNDVHQWAYAVWQVLQPLSEETRAAVQRDAGEDKVKALVGLLLAYQESQEKQSKG